MARAVVVAQLAEWLLPTPEVHSLNPGIGDFYIERLVTVNCSEKEAILNGITYLE